MPTCTTMDFRFRHTPGGRDAAWPSHFWCGDGLATTRMDPQTHPSAHQSRMHLGKPHPEDGEDLLLMNKTSVGRTVVYERVPDCPVPNQQPYCL